MNKTAVISDRCSFLVYRAYPNREAVHLVKTLALLRDSVSKMHPEIHHRGSKVEFLTRIAYHNVDDAAVNDRGVKTHINQCIPDLCKLFCDKHIQHLIKILFVVSLPLYIIILGFVID